MDTESVIHRGQYYLGALSKTEKIKLQDIKTIEILDVIRTFSFLDHLKKVFRYSHLAKKWDG